LTFRSTTLGITTLAIIAMALVGCGGGSNDDGDSSQIAVASTSISKAQFVRDANDLCAREKKKLYPKAQTLLNKDLGANGLPTEEQYLKTLNTVLLPGLEMWVEKIGALGAPAGDESKVETFLASMQKGIDGGKDLPKSETIRIEQLLRPAGEMAKDYGIKACAFP